MAKSKKKLEKLAKAKKAAAKARMDAAIKFYNDQAKNIELQHVTKVDSLTVVTHELKLSREQVQAFLALHGLDTSAEDAIHIRVNSVDGSSMYKAHTLTFKVTREARSTSTTP